MEARKLDAAQAEPAVRRFQTLGPGDSDSMRHVLYAGGSICRGIETERVALVRSLFDSGLVDELMNAGLLTPSTLVEHGVGGYPLAVEQNELTPPNRPAEVPPSMRRDAGLLLLRLARALDRRGLALRDADLSGVIVDRRGRPAFHNLAAILPKETRKFPYAEFHANFLGPLRLIDRRPELAGLVQRAGTVEVDEDISLRRPLLRGAVRRLAGLGGPGRRSSELYRRFVALSPFGGLLHCGLYGTFLRETLRERRHRARTGTDAEAQWTDALLGALERRLEGLEFDRVAQRWTNYYGHLDLSAIARAGDDWKRHYQGDREQALIRVLSEGPKGTLLDVGANNGYFSMLGAHLGFATTAVDFDIGAIDSLYCLLKDAASPLPIRPFVLDFVNLDRKHWARFEADAVFALGFVHHMRLVELLPWSVIAERLAGLTRRVLVTEFKPGTFAARAKQELTREVAGDHTLDRFVEALGVHFGSVEVIGDFTAAGSKSPRTMVVCRR